MWTFVKTMVSFSVYCIVRAILQRESSRDHGFNNPTTVPFSLGVGDFEVRQPQVCFPAVQLPQTQLPLQVGLSEGSFRIQAFQPMI